MKKKLLAIMLVLCLALTLMPAAVLAQDIGSPDISSGGEDTAKLGTVETISKGGKVETVGNKTIVTFSADALLQWSPAEGERNAGWQAGIKVTAPEGATESNVGYQRVDNWWTDTNAVDQTIAESKSTDGSPYWTTRDFMTYKDSPEGAETSYITLWALVEPWHFSQNFGDADHNLYYRYRFDWDGTEVTPDAGDTGKQYSYEQEIIIKVTPSVQLGKDNIAAETYMGGKLFNGYANLKDAVDEAVSYKLDGVTVKLLKNLKGEAIKIGASDGAGSQPFASKGITFDLGGNTYTVQNPGVGSGNIKSECFQFLKGNKVTLKNGTVNVSEENLKAAEGVKQILIMIQNYADLTLDGVTLDGTNIVQATWKGSNDFPEGTTFIMLSYCGKVNINNTTFINSKQTEEGKDLPYAIGCGWWENNKSYTDGTQITIGENCNFDNAMITRSVADSDPENIKSSITVGDKTYSSQEFRKATEGEKTTTEYVGFVKYLYDKDKNELVHTIEEVEVAPAAPAVSTDKLGDVSDDQKTALTNAVGKTESDISEDPEVNKLATNEAAAITEQQASEYITAAEAVDSTNSQGYNKVLVSPYLKMDITAYKEETADPAGGTAQKSLTVDITPMYKTQVVKVKDDGTVDGTVKAYTVPDSDKNMTDTINKNKIAVELQVGLPSDFVTDGGSGYPDVYVSHDGKYEYVAKVTSKTDGSETFLIATFTNPHGFSEFEINTKEAAVATIVEGDSEQRFTTLQAAVDAVENNGEITVKTGNALSAKVSGDKTFKIKAGDGTTLNLTLTAASGYTISQKNESGTITVTSKTYTGGGGYVPPTPTNTITAPTAANGKVTLSSATAKQGDTVTITVTPDEGYELDKLTVTDASGKTVPVTKGADGKYTFTMPATAVKVEASFKAKAVEPELPFTDVKEGNWFYDAVKYVYDNGMMNGVGNRKFDPMGTTNRAMIVTMIYRLEGEPSAPASTFQDVPAGQWYTKAVDWAASTGIVKGYTSESFGPMDNVTREQMVTILYRYAQYKGYDVTASQDISGFTDASGVSAYALPAMRWAVAEGLIKGMGDNTLSPGGIANRAEVATIFMRFCENIAK